MARVKKKICLYLDDERTPTEDLPGYSKWKVVRSYSEFTGYITHFYQKNKKLPDLISFDHDLGEEHIKAFTDNPNTQIDYTEFKEKTGFHCAKWLIELCIRNNISFKETRFAIHSHNPVGAMNIWEYLNFSKRKIYGPEFADAYYQKFKFTMNEVEIQETERESTDTKI